MEKEPEKICTKCKVPKPLSQFGKAIAAADGKAWHCKKCVAEVETKKRNERKEYRHLIF